MFTGCLPSAANNGRFFGSKQNQSTLERYMNAYLRGAIAGAVATIPMTLVMAILHRRLPQTRHRPEPPIEITAEVAKKAGMRKLLAGPRLLMATFITHFGFGAATGAMYAPLATQPRVASNAGGILFGLGVWAASYLGWVPALRILPPATRHPAQRNMLMILAHVAWGASLAATNRALLRNNVR